MLQAWMSYGYIVLLAIVVLAYVLWRRRGGRILAIASVVVGIPLWFGWEYARPTWTTGVVTGTEVRRSDPDARGNTTDIQYIYMRNRVRPGARADQRGFLVVVEAQQRSRLQRRQDRAGSQHGNDPHVERVALHAPFIVPQRDRHRPRRLLAAVVGADHHVLRPLRPTLARLLLRLLQAATVECLGGCSQTRSRVIQEPPCQSS